MSEGELPVSKLSTVRVCAVTVACFLVLIAGHRRDHLSLAGAFQTLPQPSEDLTLLRHLVVWVAVGPVDTSTWTESIATGCRLNIEDVISNDYFGAF